MAKPMKGRVAAMVLALGLGAALGLGPSTRAQADDVEIVYKDAAFAPAEIEVPAGKAFRISIRNEDAKPIEFESHAMRIEKIIAGGKTGVVRVKALKAGTYEFVNEFNEKATGKVVAK